MIKVKSISDVITNSSSEVFVIKDKIPLEDVKKVFREKVKGCNDPVILDKDSDIVRELLYYDNFFVDPNNRTEVENYYLTLMLAENFYDDDCNPYPNKDYHYEDLKKYIDERLDYLARFYNEKYKNLSINKYNPFSNPNIDEVSDRLESYPEGFISRFIKESGIELPEIPEDKLVESIYGHIGVRSKGDNMVDLESFENIYDNFKEVEHYHLG